MLRFRVHEFNLGSRNYVLLPKLNSVQILMIGKKLKERGFVIRSGQSMTAKRGRTIIKYDTAGLCWSNSDLSDTMLPHIPGLLASPKEEVPMVELRRRYFGVRSSGRGATIRFRPRIEGGPVWRELRWSGLCALTPDEHAVLTFLLEHASGPLNMVTDFATAAFRRRIINGRQFFETKVSAPLATSTLSNTERQGTRNSYLPQDGVLQLSRFDSPSRQEYAELFVSFGEWCYLQAK